MFLIDPLTMSLGGTQQTQWRIQIAMAPPPHKQISTIMKLAMMYHVSHLNKMTSAKITKNHKTFLKVPDNAICSSLLAEPKKILIHKNSENFPM